MNRGVFLVTFALVCSGAVSGQSRESGLTCSQSAGAEKPDLVPVLPHPMNGKIVVKNLGKGLAAPSKMTLDCEKMSTPVSQCPDLPISAASTYFDPAFPKNATINVPQLAPGATFEHTLSFWETLHWPSGRYRFTAVADAAHVLSERNTKNNIAVSTLVVP